MRVVTSGEMRELDRWAIREVGVPGVVLMENAGRGVMRAMAKEFGDPSRLSIAIACGKGNNGGDGFVVARHLLNLGASVTVLLLGRIGEVRGDARVNLDIVRKMGMPIEEITGERKLGLMKRRLKDCDLIVDAIFGTGFKGEAKRIVGKSIGLINSSGIPVVAIDIPSGVNSDNGSAPGPTVKASITCTMNLLKAGLVLYPGREFCGDIYLVDIGSPRLEPKGPWVELVGKELIRGLLPSRPPSGHKGSFGRLLVVGGSRGMSGAAALASYSALRSGAGLVYLAIPQSLNQSMEASLTEVITIPLPETPEGSISMHALSEIKALLTRVDVLALGPGLSTDPETGELVRRLVPKLRIPTVVDADGLNNLVPDPGVVKKVRAPLVLTPHPRELSRLIKKTIPQIEGDRIGFAQKAAKEFGCALVLKGAPTVTAEPEGCAWVNPTGNSGLATAGSGDVLTGVIGGMLAQGLSPLDSGIVGAYLHGLAGDFASEEVTPYGVVAGDVMDMIPEAIADVLEERREDLDEPVLRRVG